MVFEIVVGKALTFCRIVKTFAHTGGMPRCRIYLSWSHLLIKIYQWVFQACTIPKHFKCWYGLLYIIFIIQHWSFWGFVFIYLWWKCLFNKWMFLVFRLDLGLHHLLNKWFSINLFIHRVFLRCSSGVRIIFSVRAVRGAMLLWFNFVFFIRTS